MRTLRLTTVALSAALAVTQVGCGGGGDKKGTPPAITDSSKGGPPGGFKPDFTVTSEALAKEFLADAKAAKAKYKAKVIEVSGPVTGLLFEDDKAAVSLQGAEKDVLGVFFNCTLLGAHRDAGTRLDKGQKVQLVGKFHDASGSVVMLFDCSLKELEPSKIFDVTAAAVAEEFQKDAKAAQKKYNDQWILITGEVIALPTKENYSYVTLKGKDPVNVRVTLAGSAQKQLTKGQTVTLHAEGMFPELEKTNEVGGFGAGFIASGKK
jgi:hypothetical protein